MTPRRSSLALLGLLLVALAAGCSTKGTLVPNLPPETTVFVSGPVDTVGLNVHLHWFGSDTDGEVVRYEFKWIYPAGEEPANYDSNTWFSTTRVDSQFTVYTPDGVSMPTFVIRSVDDQGEPDPTPARQQFTFTNLPPSVHFGTVPQLADTTFPVATLRWTATDPDGNIANAQYLLWLDGHADDPIVIQSATTVTIPPARFSDGAGGYETGRRTAYIQAIDAGGGASLPDSFSWEVLAPVGDVLLIDDTPEDNSGPIDGMYTDALDLQLGAGNYTVLRLQTTDPFRTSQDMAATFSFFESVLWYADNAPAPSGTLRLAEPAIRDQLAADKNVFLTSVFAVGTSGSLPSKAFLNDIVGADSVIVNSSIGTTNFSLNSDAVLTPGPAVPYDSLQALVIADNIEAFVLRNPLDAAYIARAGLLSPTQNADWPVAVDRVPQGGLGKFVFFAFPLRLLGGTPPGAPDPSPDFNYGQRTVREVLFRFGHGSAP